MTNVAVVGSQWGDEGKGKVVDLLASRFDVVARYQGGPNAGHTVAVGDETFGPVETERSGAIEIPIVVPPGLSTVFVTITRGRRERRQSVDVRLRIVGPPREKDQHGISLVVPGFGTYSLFGSGALIWICRPQSFSTGEVAFRKALPYPVLPRGFM